MNPELFGQVIYLTVVLIALCVPLVFMLYMWNKSRKSANSVLEMKKELSGFDKLKNKGVLTPEEHKRIAQRLSQEIVNKTLQESEKQQDLSAEDLLTLLAHQARQKPKEDEKNTKD